MFHKYQAEGHNTPLDLPAAVLLMQLMMRLTWVVNWFTLLSYWTMMHVRALWIDKRFMKARRWKDLFLYKVVSSISLPTNWPLCNTLRIKKGRKGKWYKQKRMSEDQKELLGQTQKGNNSQVPKYMQTGIWIFLEMFKLCIMGLQKYQWDSSWCWLGSFFLLISCLKPTCDLSTMTGLYS